MTGSVDRGLAWILHLIINIASSPCNEILVNCINKPSSFIMPGSRTNGRNVDDIILNYIVVNRPAVNSSRYFSPTHYTLWRVEIGTGNMAPLLSVYFDRMETDQHRFLLILGKAYISVGSCKYRSSLILVEVNGKLDSRPIHAYSGNNKAC